jgi:hypothetical protein
MYIPINLGWSFGYVNQRLEKPKRQSRMDNPETLEILGTRRGRKRIEVLANDMQFLLLIGRLSKCVFYFNGKKHTVRTVPTSYRKKRRRK